MIKKLLLLGNGFDLAHDIPTSYTDFLQWWLDKKKNDLGINNATFNDVNIIRITHPTHSYALPADEWNYKYVEDQLNSNAVRWKNDFLLKIFRQVNRNKNKGYWVNIEELYYQELLSHFRKSPKGDIKLLNANLNRVKKLLIEYLKSDLVREKIKSSKKRFDFSKYGKDDLIVCFNYTNTIEKYYDTWPDEKSRPQVIPIHGSLSDKNYPIIFGYGDEIDPGYKELQDQNDNELLTHFKTFQYLQGSYHAQLEWFLKSNSYDVEILGMSCGLSDRVLLNTILDRKECIDINIKCYPDRADFIDKCYNLSRHFKNPSTVRSKIRGFSDESIIK
ncbi:AbiH family protein [Marivirga tractuosa]|uniref:AbiH family protein n=1 Tax=Marivirga tractuosa TaxID=1006 RepID=UPI0035D0A7F8